MDARSFPKPMNQRHMIHDALKNQGRRPTVGGEDKRRFTNGPERTGRIAVADALTPSSRDCLVSVSFIASTTGTKTRCGRGREKEMNKMAKSLERGVGSFTE
jgi:hypothetical protein